jgi:hypothetical protein
MGAKFVGEASFASTAHVIACTDEAMAINRVMTLGLVQPSLSMTLFYVDILTMHAVVRSSLNLVIVNGYV